MKLLLKVEMDDGQVLEAPVRPRTQVAFERHFTKLEGKPVRLDEGVSMEHLYWLAWHSLKIGESFEQWLETVDEVKPIVQDDDDGEGPLGTAPLSGSSLQPPSNQDTVSLSTS